MIEAQREDTQLVFAGVENAGLLDFVAAWYVKAAHYLRGETPASAGWPAGAHEPSVFKIAPTGQPAPASGDVRANVRCAFVSTNSITQGEQVGVLWGWLLAQGVHIHFAHRTFSWSNEASGKAAVHCVIIGFGLQDLPGKVIFEYDNIRGEPHAVAVNHINPYLVDAPDVVLPRRSRPICDVPQIVFGSMANDGGYLFLNATEKSALLDECPTAANWIRPFLGADEFINNIPRWCLWLRDCPPSQLRSMPAVLARVLKVKGHRNASSRAVTQALAATPTLFGEIRQPADRYLLVPRHSSERRALIPIGFLSPNVIIGDANLCVPDATLFHFGIMTSGMHMAWVRYVCGRIKSDYRYTNQIVYNNFPWPELLKNAEPSSAQTAIESAAQTVLDVRARFQTGEQPATLADLYDPLTMPPELLKAHQRLDAAVDKAYEASGGKKHYKSDAERVAFLFELYQKYTSLLPTDNKSKPRKFGRKTQATEGASNL
ncbi:MAG: hypothetical protein NDI87_13180 [Rhodoferax sp.]|nr:type IIL restriction-modification enzyme MmeI [Rhodoferax sp.]MCM2342101.1 hypothetical protein [Rhodoferax sp.]